MTDKTILPFLDDEELEEGSMSLTDIYNMVVANQELILTIPADEEERLRKGLASVKAKTNKKLQEEGMPVDKSMLSYITTPVMDNNKQPTGNVQIHIILGKPNGITVLGIKLPDSEI